MLTQHAQWNRNRPLKSNTPRDAIRHYQAEWFAHGMWTREDYDQIPYPRLAIII